MYQLKVENKYGQQLELTNNEAYVVTDVDGLYPADGTINTTRNASADGSVFNSSYVNEKQIIITLSINSPAEENRINLYRYFKTKEPVKVYFKNDSRNVFIEGYVKNCNIGFFDKKQIFQSTITCPDPYFKNTNPVEVDFSKTIPLFEFPFSIEEGEPIPFSDLGGQPKISINNSGDVEAGFIIHLYSRNDVVNPVVYSETINQYIGLNMTLRQGEEVIINTIKKQRSVTLISGGTKTNLINKLKFGSEWIYLIAGYNTIGVSADSNIDDMEVNCELNVLYEGV